MFIIFLKKFGLEKNPFFTKFSRSPQNIVMYHILLWIRCNEHGKTTKSTLLTETVKSVIVDVGNTFRENFRRDPTQDANNKMFSSIPDVIRGYKYRYPNTQH